MTQIFRNKTGSNAAFCRKIVETITPHDWRGSLRVFTYCLRPRGYSGGPAGFVAHSRALIRSIWSNADESRRQHVIPRNDLRGSDPRIAAAVRLGAEHRHHRGGVVGVCAFVARRFRGAVRPVRFGARRNLDRSRQRHSVHRLCAHLDRRARIRSSAPAADTPVRRRRACGSSSAACRPWQASFNARVLLSSGIITAYTWAAAYEFWRGRSEPLVSRWPAIFMLFAHGSLYLSAHAVRRHAAVVADQQRGVRERLADRAQLRGAVVHHRHRLHPARHGQGAHRTPPQDGVFDRSADRHRQSPRFPAGRRGAVEAAGDRSAADRGDAARSRQFQIHQRPLRPCRRRSGTAALRASGQSLHAPHGSVRPARRRGICSLVGRYSRGTARPPSPKKSAPVLPPPPPRSRAGRSSPR